MSMLQTSQFYFHICVLNAFKLQNNEKGKNTHKYIFFYFYFLRLLLSFFLNHHLHYTVQVKG